MKKEKKLVEVKAENSKEKVTLDKDGRIVKSNEVVAIPKEGAKPRRIGAVILWLLAIACELVAVLNIFNKLELPKFGQLTWLIVLIVLDLIFVVCGSLLWKKANHIDPVSEKNKTKFWLWNNLGTIMAFIAFVPLIIIIFTNKNLDGKTKKIAGIVAIVALAIGGIFSYDFNPVSSEKLNNAKAEILANGNYDTNENNEPIVYWLEHSTKYHINKNCQHINRKGTTDELKWGTIEAAFQKGLTEPCRTCIKEIQKNEEKKQEKTGD